MIPSLNASSLNLTVPCIRSYSKCITVPAFINATEEAARSALIRSAQGWILAVVMFAIAIDVFCIWRYNRGHKNDN